MLPTAKLHTQHGGPVALSQPLQLPPTYLPPTLPETGKGLCCGINLADPHGRPLKWVIDNDIPGGVFKRGTWSVFVSDSRDKIFHPDCSGLNVLHGDAVCCSACEGMWRCVTRAQVGSVKPPFYRHVVNNCRNNALNIPVRSFQIQHLRRRGGDRQPAQLPIVQKLNKRWGTLCDRDKDLLQDQVANIGRVGKAKRGNRWSTHSKGMCLRLNLTIGWQQLGNMCLPGRTTINNMLPSKYAPVGMQPDVYSSFGGFFKSCDVTLSGDDLSLNGSINVIASGNTFQLVGNANALDTCKHGPATVYSFSSADDAPNRSDIPIATNVLIHVIHSPTPHSPTVVTHLFPHNGLQLEDYLLVLHTIELSVPISNIGYDNFSCQLQMKSGCMRPFTVKECEYLSEQGAGVQGPEPDLCKFAAMAVALVRPVSIVMQQYLMTTCSTAPTLPIPYPYVTNFSCVSSKHLCISPEYRHTLRLWTKHYRDKRSKLIVWDFTTYSSMTFMDVYTLYVRHPVHSGLRFQCIDQSDSTLNNERAYDLHQYPLIQALIQNVYGSQSTALHLFIGSAYLNIFRGKGVSKLAAIALAHFCSSALVCQRVMVLRSKGLTLQAHSYTTPTTFAMLQDCAGFIYMALKRNGSRAFEPAHCGEWQNESLNAKVRCPGTMQFTSNVSMYDVQQRLSRIGLVEQIESDIHDSEAEPELSMEDVHQALAFGWDMWCGLAAGYGMGDLVKSFKSYSLLFSEHLRLSKPEVSQVVSWKDWAEYIKGLDHKVKNPAGYKCEDMRARFADELQGFLNIYDMLLDRTTHKQGHTIADMPVAQDEGDCAIAGEQPHHLAISSFVARKYNGDLRGQTKHILGRFATQDHLRGNPMSTAIDADNAVGVGLTYAFVFDVDREDIVRGRKVTVRDQVVFIGLLRNLVAALKEGAKGRRSLITVDGEDRTAVYYCYPYAKVTLSNHSAPKLQFEVMKGEVPTYFALSDGCTVTDIAEGEAGEARDGEEAEPMARRSKPVGGSNLKELLSVEWTRDGPVLLDKESKAALRRRVKDPDRPCA